VAIIRTFASEMLGMKFSFGLLNGKALDGVPERSARAGD
jgi:hypothetical protein